MKTKNSLLLAGAFILCIGTLIINRYQIREILTEQSRAHDVVGTFIRMSPDLRREHERYLRECFRKPTCDTRSYIARRDQIITRDWPRVYDYLKHRDNWGSFRLTAYYRDEFFRETEGFTPFRLRNDYIPVLQYRGYQLVLYPCSTTDRRRYVPKEYVISGRCK